MIEVSHEQRTRLLSELATDAGLCVFDLLTDASVDSVVPGICVECSMPHYSCEPDMEDGACEGCGSESVQSCLVLAELI